MNSNSDFQVQMEQRVRKIEAMLMEYLPRQRGYSDVSLTIELIMYGRTMTRCKWRNCKLNL